MNLTHATRADQKRKSALRLDPEQLVRLAEALPPGDAGLIRGRFAEGLTYRDLAHRYHIDSRRARRQVARLAERLQSPEFRFTLLHEKKLPVRLRKTAKLLFIHGRSLRDTARATGHSLHRVRTDRATLQTLARAAG